MHVEILNFFFFYYKQEVDTDDHSKSETDWANLCSQGNHPHLYLDEQVGIICECCSVVVEEIRHILPDFVSYMLFFFSNSE